MALPTRAVGMAAAVALAVLVLVLGCVVDDAWWSMFTTVCYLMAGQRRRDPPLSLSVSASI